MDATANWEKEIEEHYRDFESLYADSKFNAIYSSLNPFISVSFLSSGNELRESLRQYGYSNTEIHSQQIQKLIEQHLCNSVIGVDAGWLTDFIYFIFRTSGEQFILCHYHRQESKWKPRFMTGLANVVIGSTALSFQQNILTAIEVAIQNNVFLEHCYKVLEGLAKFWRYDDLGKVVKDFLAHVQSKESDETKRQDLIQACVIFKAFKFLKVNAPYFATKLQIRDQRVETQ